MHKSRVVLLIGLSLFAIGLVPFIKKTNNKTSDVPQRSSYNSNTILNTTIINASLLMNDAVVTTIYSSNTFNVPYNENYTGFKCYEYYDLITDESSLSYQLQQKAITDDKGFRKINNRYLIAVGTHWNCDCGTKLDLILENGTIIPCIVGDIKADVDTDETRTFSTYSMCCSEFIVDKNQLDTTVKNTGDVSNAYNEWKSKVIQFRILPYNTVKL